MELPRKSEFKGSVTVEVYVDDMDKARCEPVLRLRMVGQLPSPGKVVKLTPAEVDDLCVMLQYYKEEVLRNEIAKKSEGQDAD